MFITETQIRIHYALTDQMGVVYHGHYAQFYEIARTEAIRQVGYTYKDIEAMGIIMPVIDIHSHKIVFHHEIYNEADELLNTGDVTLYFMLAKEMKRCDMPVQLKEVLKQYF
jgi:acyl-CoA thioester hydrolase